MNESESDKSVVRRDNESANREQEHFGNCHALRLLMNIISARNQGEQNIDMHSGRSYTVFEK